MGDPLDMAAAFMAFQRQAPEHIAACREQLAAAGLGFSAEDRDEIAAQASAHPLPPGQASADTPASAEDIAAAQAVAAKAMTAEYPPDGFAADDPRLAPIEGVSLALYAMAAKAIGWSREPEFIDRVVRALGLDPATWERASAAWTERITDDVVLAAFYGQLFTAA